MEIQESTFRKAGQSARESTLARPEAQTVNTLKFNVFIKWFRYSKKYKMISERDTRGFKSISNLLFLKLSCS